MNRHSLHDITASKEEEIGVVKTIHTCIAVLHTYGVRESTIACALETRRLQRLHVVTTAVLDQRASLRFIYTLVAASNAVLSLPRYAFTKYVLSFRGTL